MINANCNIILVESALYNIAFQVSAKVFGGVRPLVTDDTMGSFIVVKVTGTMVDWSAYGRGMATFYIYAKNLQGGIRDNPTLATLGQKLKDLLPSNDGTYLIEYHGETGFPDNNGFYVIAVNTYVTVLN